jgi:ZIP family zinc transporter
VVSTGPSAAIWVAILLLALLSGVTTFVGVGLALSFGASATGIATAMGFSAGIMILIATVELVPESVGEVGLLGSLATFALGAAAVASLQVIVPHTHPTEDADRFDAHLLRGAYLVAFGLVLHDLPEGFAMANAYVASPSLGFLVALVIALHNVPEEFAMAVAAVALRKRRFLFMAALFSALAEPAGAILGVVAVHLDPELNLHFMAFAAGAMVFVSFHELFPMARRYGNLRLFAAGAAASIPVYALLSLAVPR